MFIYADITDYQLVGDAHARRWRVTILQFDSPHYTPVSKTLIDDIEINLKDDQNQHIPFLYGKVLVKLHFCPIRQHLKKYKGWLFTTQVKQNMYGII